MAPQPIDDPGADGKPGTRDDVKVMSAGGHSFAMEGKWKFSKTPEKGEVDVENIGACNVKECHGGSITTFNRTAFSDFDGNGTVEGVQDEVKGLLALLEKELPKDEKGNVLSYPVTPKNTSEEQRKALWNYWLIKNDGSLGIHNTAFSVELLQTTYRQLTGRNVR